MSINVCVIYSDIVDWSKQNTADQVSSVLELFTHLNKRILDQGLHLTWKVSTGDGFAVAFPRDEAKRVFELCHDLLDQYVRYGRLQLRLALSEGSLDTFDNPLTGTHDATGPAVIKTRRILDGITGGNTLLVQKDLMEDLKKELPHILVPYIIPRPQITDKHGDTHDVVQSCRPCGAKREGVVSYLNH